MSSKPPARSNFMLKMLLGTASVIVGLLIILWVWIREEIRKFMNRYNLTYLTDLYLHVDNFAQRVSNPITSSAVGQTALAPVARILGVQLSTKTPVKMPIAQEDQMSGGETSIARRELTQEELNSEADIMSQLDTAIKKVGNKFDLTPAKSLLMMGLTS